MASANAVNDRGAIWICAIGISVGVMGIVGSAIWLCAAAAYGGPRDWLGLVVLFLLTGPLALLPLAILGIWRRRWAGRALVCASIANALFALLVMWPPLDSWSGSPGEIRAYALRWSLALIVPVSLPILALGLGLLRYPRT